MGLFDFFTARGRAAALYQRGMEKAKAGDRVGAIADYTSLIENRRCPDDLKAMTLFNRGLVYYLARDLDSARKDFEAIAEMKGVPSNVASAAREKLNRIKSRKDRSEE
jgi:tetratricopeptide (TPR) repeat protein